MCKKNVRILGTASTLGDSLITNEELEKKLGLTPGWIHSNSGVETRYHEKSRDASDLGAIASHKALEQAKLPLEAIDLVIGCSGVPQQAIPCYAALVHKKLSMKKTPAFDVNATCLSFLIALSIAAELIASSQYQNILLVTGDLASPGLNPKDPKTATLFGDGATATIVGPSQDYSSCIQKMHFETWSEKQEACVLEVGGSKLHTKILPEEEKYRNYFQMDGRTLAKVTLPVVMDVIDRLLIRSHMSYHDLALCIPHQTSPFGMRLLRKKIIKTYGTSKCLLVDIVKQFGNMIATSIPHALDVSIRHGMLKRGDKLLLIGSSAGISVAGAILEY